MLKLSNVHKKYNVAQQWVTVSILSERPLSNQGGSNANKQRLN
jgi:hypothetical protein